MPMITAGHTGFPIWATWLQNAGAATEGNLCSQTSIDC
jgi:hypothetical protein